MQNWKSGDKFFNQVMQLFRDAKRKMSMSVTWLWFILIMKLDG